MKNKWQNINSLISTISAGLIAVVIAFTSSVALIYQAVINLGGDASLVASWLLTLGVAMGILTILLSYFYSMPILIAWSTPGAALLIANIQGFSIEQATAGFIISAVLLLLVPLLLPLDKLFRYLPAQICSAMLAGILLSFGLSLFEQMNQQPLLISAMFLCYLVSKRFAPQWSLLIVLLLSIFLAWQLQLIEIKVIPWQLSEFVYIHPSFSWEVVTGISLPLFIITMAAQNLPGIAMLQSFSYQPPIKPILSSVGLINVIAAPFGGYALNLAAISAAICMTDEVHPDPKKRYWASIFAGVFYLLLGLFAAYLMAWFALLPAALIVALAGIALLGTITHSLQHTLNSNAKHINEAAVVTLLVTASPISLWGLSSVIWGLFSGVLILQINRYKSMTVDSR